MNKSKAIFQSCLNRVGDALHQKPMRFFGVLMLCFAGVAYAFAPAKEAAAYGSNNPPAIENSAKGGTKNIQPAISSESELANRMDKLEERERQLYALSLDASRKNIDWLFSFLAVLTTLVGIAGAFLPWLMGRKDKELLQSELQNARDLVNSIKGHEESALQKVAAIEENLEKVKSFQSGGNQSPADHAQIQEAAQKVSEEPTSSDSEKLRARAVLASQKDQPTHEEANTAYELWFALAVMKPDDAAAHFNSGYWAQQLYKHTDTKDRSRWLTVLQKHYQRRLELKKDSHAAAYNWGNALDDEAQALNDQDLPAARALWRQAGEKYALALEINKDKHEAANNWGSALVNEAKALKDHDLPVARTLWKQAGEKYARALEIKKDFHKAANNWGVALVNEAQTIQASAPDEAQMLLAQAQNLLERHRDMGEDGAQRVAYNLACVYAQQKHAGLAVAQLELCRLSGKLDTGASHWRTDPDLDPIRQSPEYVAWKSRHFPHE